MTSTTPGQGDVENLIGQAIVRQLDAVLYRPRERRKLQPASRCVSHADRSTQVARVLSAARSGQKFKVIIVIRQCLPCENCIKLTEIRILAAAIPGFSGDLVGNSATLAIIGATYRSSRSFIYHQDSDCDWLTRLQSAEEAVQSLR